MIKQTIEREQENNQLEDIFYISGNGKILGSRYIMEHPAMFMTPNVQAFNPRHLHNVKAFR